MSGSMEGSTVVQPVPVGFHPALRWCGRVVLAALGFPVGLAIGGAVLTAASLKPPVAPPSLSPNVGMPVACLVLAACLAPLAARLRGSFLARWLALSGFVYISLGVNTAIEASVFSRMGGMLLTALAFLPGSLLLSLALIWKSADGSAGGVSQYFAGRSAGAWAWRLALAWLAFPLAYYTFGMLVVITPWAIQAYQSGAYGLQLPPAAVVIQVQLLRSLLYLASTIPVLLLARRGGMAWRLGLASWATVGLFGMLQASFFPLPLRLLHTFEIGLDSFAWAWMVVTLLRPVGGQERQP